MQPSDREAIDVVSTPIVIVSDRHLGCLQWLECPVILVLGALFNPLSDQFSLGIGDGFLATVRWWHHVVGIHGGDALVEQGRFGIAGNDGGEPIHHSGGGFEGVQTEVGHLCGRVWAMAKETAIRQDRSDVPAKSNGCSTGRRCRGGFDPRGRGRLRGGVGGGLTGDPQRDGENGNARCDDSLIGGSHTQQNTMTGPEDEKIQAGRAGNFWIPGQKGRVRIGFFAKNGRFLRLRGRLVDFAKRGSIFMRAASISHETMRVMGCPKKSSPVFRG